MHIGSRIKEVCEQKNVTAQELSKDINLTETQKTQAEKEELARKEIDKNDYKCLIEVDGGINAETGKLCRDAGVDILVAGSYIYGHDDYKERFESLR